MCMRRITAALLSLALIAGCSAGARQTEAPSTPPASQALDKEPAPATQGDAPKEVNLPPATELVKPVKGVLTKVTYGKGEAIAKPGLQYLFYGNNGGPLEVTVIRRYNWQGEKLAEYRVVGRLAEISPDGRLAATRAYLSFTSSVSLFDLSTGKPLFRVAGAFGGTWLAGDKEFLVNTLDFGGRLVSTGGAMRAAPARPRRDFWYMGFPLPSPADANLFAWGPVVLDRAGQVVAESPLAESTGRFIRVMQWTPSGREVYFSVEPAPGKDGDIGYRPIIAPAVQKAPFPEKYLLQVNDPKDECLNLRDTSSTGGKVIRCLPTGTKLAIGDLDKIGEKGAVWQYGDERVWLWVVTEKGEEGWVASDTGSLAWAE